MTSYQYANNNPLKYVDKDGESATAVVFDIMMADLATPDPSDAFAGYKVGGYVIALVGASAVDYFTVKKAVELVTTPPIATSVEGNTELDKTAVENRKSKKKAKVESAKKQKKEV